MMNFIEIAKKRYSVRNYSGKKVEKEKLDKILQAAHVAPTAANLQPVHLIAVESKEGLEKISKGANIYNAPLAIIVCADHNKAYQRKQGQHLKGLCLPPFIVCSLILSNQHGSAHRHANTN